jgi:hypothetical protein
MVTHSRMRIIRITPLLALLLALFVSGPAAGQAAVNDSARASTAVKDVPLTAQERQAFIGRYTTIMPAGERTLLVVSEQDGQLRAQPEGMGPIRILYQGDNRFRPEGIPDFEFHFEISNGRATKFTVQKEDGLMVGVRLD